jgi:bifunctional UDP-N-acetylglucosamine pyrophosphorylase / glucosamine-1-phosphate N-acetyltransferase
MNIVVLAAGMGKRMKSDLPKVLHPIAGTPLLGHVLSTARRLMDNARNTHRVDASSSDATITQPAGRDSTKSSGQLVVIYGHGGDIVPNRLAADDIVWAKQEPQLGTGHAVMQAVPFLNDDVPTLILYGDVPLTRLETLEALIAAAGAQQLGILTVHLPDPTGYGRIVRKDGRICAIVEQKDADEATRKINEINSGILVAPTRQLKRWLVGLTNNNVQKEYYLTDIVAAAVNDAVAIVATHPKHTWETDGVNSKIQLAELERIHQRNIADELMEAGVTLADPARIDVRGSLVCGRDVFIDVNCVFEGKVELGDGVQLGPNCVLRDASIGARTEVFGFTHIVKASIGIGGQIGPFARLRPGTELGDDNHIGNFVEIKATRMGNHSKANHLSYVGDAHVGQRVNIGAGTITCNYDGANKHLTIIEDDVHIGSDTQLVAPVTVGKGSTTAAGTTVWKTVPADSLVLNSKDQVHRSAWKRPVKLKKS